jgi:putative hemolysin
LGDQAGHYAAMDATVPSFGGTAVVSGLLGLMALYGLFAASETAVDLLRPLHVRLYRETDPERSRRLQHLLDRQAKYVAAAAVGADFVRTAIVFVGLFLAPGVSRWLQASFGLADDLGTLVLAAILVAIPISLLNMVGSLIPRSYASRQPHVTSARLYGFLRASFWLLGGPALLVSHLAGWVGGLFGTKASFALANQAEEEIKTLAETARESGQIEEGEKELLHSVFDFTDTVAREVMTPRVDLDALPVSSDPADVLRLITESGHSRIPLYEGTDDEIVGVVHAKDLLRVMVEGGDINLRALMRRPFFVPESRPLRELLADMKAEKTQIAIVKDELGGTAGIVTVEDIVEELVGDIVDEYDNETDEVKAESENVWIIDGRTHLDDVNDKIGSSLESEEFDSVGGYIFGVLGRQPKLGETVEDSGYRFEVTETDGRRIKQLRVTRLEPSDVEVETIDA